MAKLINPNNYKEYFFLWDEASGFVIPSPISPTQLGEIVAQEDVIGRKNAKIVFNELWDSNLAHYKKYLEDRGIWIEYDKRTNEISMKIRTVNPVSSAGG